MSVFTPEEIAEDLQNEQEFLDYFEQKNIESLHLFVNKKQYSSLSNCFLIKHYGQMPRISLVYYGKSNCPDDLAYKIINKYRQLFGKWARFSVQR